MVKFTINTDFYHFSILNELQQFFKGLLCAIKRTFKLEFTKYEYPYTYLLIIVGNF